jgi:hypothetical protein
VVLKIFKTNAPSCLSRTYGAHGSAPGQWDRPSDDPAFGRGQLRRERDPPGSTATSIACITAAAAVRAYQYGRSRRSLRKRHAAARVNASRERNPAEFADGIAGPPKIETDSPTRRVALRAPR